MGVEGEEPQNAADAVVVHEPLRRNRVAVGGAALPQPLRGSGGWRELREWTEWKTLGNGNQGESVCSQGLSSGAGAPQRMGMVGAEGDQHLLHSLAPQC